ncbi:XisI protein [Tumidithrix helvetica PCC 7403]|uniref:XisI protein n=1 Tax=Tumidithrix helvetica TaxID=3457545 RepID=UPI003C8CF46A
MDRLDRYRQIIRTVLKPYADIRYANVNVKNRSAFDTETDQYIILSEGWDKLQHLHGVLLHVEIVDGKVWIQVDGTEYGIAQELLQSGVPKEDIVLGFHEPSIRPLTGFAVA